MKEGGCICQQLQRNCLKSMNSFTMTATVDGLRLMCEGLNKAPKATEKYFLEVLACFQATEKR